MYRLLPILFLAGCASQPSIESIHAQTKARVYPYQVTTPKNEWKFVPDGSYEKGNCTTFAATAKALYQQAGYNPEVKVCRLPSGQAHAYVLVEGMVSDQINRFPVPREGFDCADIPGWKDIYTN